MPKEMLSRNVSAKGIQRPVRFSMVPGLVTPRNSLRRRADDEDPG